MPGVYTIFRNRLRPDAEPEYGVWARRMAELAGTMPGFVAIKTFAADDGERVSIVEFDSDEHARAWAAHPEHRQAQKLGRERFYAEFELVTCTPLREIRFRAE